MSRKRRDISGMTFGRWTALEYGGPCTFKWLCICICGTKRLVGTTALLKGTSLSCGCLSRDVHTKHGMRNLPEYWTWVRMNGKCLDKSNKRYGARGIKVCDRWKESFEAFYRDMGPKPSLKHSIDRINNDGDYAPENCRWATAKEQSNNRSDNVRISYNEETLTMAQASDKYGIGREVLRNRLVKGWSIEQALTISVKKNQNHNVVPEGNNLYR